MIISGVGPVSTVNLRATEPQPQHREAAPGTALAPVGRSFTPQSSVYPRSLRPDAFFLAQLIAATQQLPQTRALRRAPAEDVQAAYRSVSHQSQAATLSRDQRTVRVA